VVLVGFKPDLDDYLVLFVPEMTYSVLSGTLSNQWTTDLPGRRSLSYVIIIIIIIKYIYIAQNRVMQLMRWVDSHTANKNVFSLCLNVLTEMSGARRSAGRLFHIRGHCMAKRRNSSWFVEQPVDQSARIKCWIKSSSGYRHSSWQLSAVELSCWFLQA